MVSGNGSPFSLEFWAVGESPMRAVGFEPTPGCSLDGRARKRDPKSRASTNSATPAGGEVHGGLVAVGSSYRWLPLNPPTPFTSGGPGPSGATVLFRVAVCPHCKPINTARPRWLSKQVATSKHRRYQCAPDLVCGPVCLYATLLNCCNQFHNSERFCSGAKCLNRRVNQHATARTALGWRGAVAVGRQRPVEHFKGLNGSNEFRALPLQITEFAV